MHPKAMVEGDNVDNIPNYGISADPATNTGGYGYPSMVSSDGPVTTTPNPGTPDMDNYLTINNVTPALPSSITIDIKSNSAINDLISNSYSTELGTPHNFTEKFLTLVIDEIKEHINNVVLLPDGTNAANFQYGGLMGELKRKLGEVNKLPAISSVRRSQHWTDANSQPIITKVTEITCLKSLASIAMGVIWTFITMVIYL